MRLAVLLVLLAGCPKPPPITPPAPDVGDAAPPFTPSGDACQDGCAALMAPAVRCGLGDGGADCAAFLRVINGGKEPNPITHKPLTCADVATVRSRADAQRLGFVCP